ncbi:UNVERIFIED_CONTAM: hypothetical protein PYX00_003143 [Menopon gallinae]|uniref:Uncharacterized protein n=1 Tax=Menopon gallinae TaxID=328185 RepID=A0AAW2HYU9_9NEOP
MPAVTQERVVQVWKGSEGRNGNAKNFPFGTSPPNGKANSPPSSPLSTSPTPRISRIPSSLLLASSSRSLSPSPPPEDRRSVGISTWLFGIGFNLLRSFISTVGYIIWTQLLIGPTLWLSAWLLLQPWPVDRSRKKRTVLISGGSTVQALHLARNFYSAGARVVVCEVEGHFGLARFSTAVNKFYTVPRPQDANAVDYVNALCAIVEKENVSYYIPVSATSEAFYDALAKPQLELLNCIVFCPTVKDVLLLDDLFEVFGKCRAAGLATPLYYHVTSRDDVNRLYESGLLHSARHFMANVGAAGVRQRIRLQVPPFRQDFRTSFEISNQKPWVIVQDLKGEHFVTCTTVKDATVVGNVTCRVEKNRGGLIPVEKEEITAWIQNFFTKLRLRPISGHFSFRFVISATSETVVPIGCKVGVSLPYICFTSVHPRIVWKPCRHFSRQSSGPLVIDRPRYWMHDAVISTLRHPSVEAVTKFIGTVLDKREALFVYWDPLPYCAYYHLQLPLRNIIDFIRGHNRNAPHLPLQRTVTPPIQ